METNTLEFLELTDMKNGSIGLLFMNLNQRLFTEIGESVRLFLKPDLMGNDRFFVVTVDKDGVDHAVGIIYKTKDNHYNIDGFEIEIYKTVHSIK